MLGGSRLTPTCPGTHTLQIDECSLGRVLNVAGEQGRCPLWCSQPLGVSVQKGGSEL